MNPAAPGEVSYEEAQHILNTQGMPGFERLAGDVHRRFDSYDAAAHPVLRRRRLERTLHHAVIDARSLPWFIQHALIDILVRRGLDLNVVDYHGRTPLHLLLQNRADNRDDDRVIAEAVRQLVTLGARLAALPEPIAIIPLVTLGFYVGPQTLRVLFEMGAGSRPANQASG